ncbi:hypothetical protein MAR_015965 [Mya arenaria]|uniref:Glycosyltransferase family 92 protein n=1 Tax=Mya arenaria TaxID=6604 RepID=A0ABY7FM36_MYAAR|nr:hypothetical protein MAR_015965 [Mya arenaria]
MKPRLFNNTRSGYIALFVLKPTYHLNNILSLTVRLRDFHAETNNPRKGFASNIENDVNHLRLLRNSEETQGNFTRSKHQNSVEISWNEDYDASSEHVPIKNNISAKLNNTRNETDDEPNADHVQYNKQAINEKSDSNGDNEIDIIADKNVDNRALLYDNSTGIKRTRAQWKDLIKKQNELYNYTLYGRAGSINVYYYSAQVFSTNVTAGKWESVVLNGWEGQGSKHTPLNCCVKVKNGSTPIMSPVERHPWKVHDSMPVNAVQFTCMIPQASSSLEPESVGLTLTVCKAVTQYIQLELVAPNDSNSTSSKFAICGKLVYGDYPAEKVFEWLEVNTAMGVDHISLYSYNVSKSIQKVLDYYEKQGRLKVKPFDFPMKCK